MRVLVSILFFLGLGLAPLSAAEPYGAPKQVMLSAKIVETFIESWEPAKGVAFKYGAQWEGKKFGDSKSNGIEKLRAYLAAKGALGEINNLVQGYGFSDFDHWSRVAYSVFLAHAFARQGPGAMNTDMAITQSMQGIESNPQLTEQQKAAYKAQMLASMGAYDKMKPSPENVEAVKPFGKQLDALLDEE